MDSVHSNLNGSFSLLSTGLTWHLLSYLEVTDLIRLSMTSKSAKQLIEQDQFWNFLYYRHLISSPYYFDLQHADMCQLQSVCWYYMYLEQLWTQCINICYLGGEPIKYFHRTLSVERDRTWEIVQPVNSRDAIGPFGAEITDFAYCYNLGFKRPQRETSLDEGEVAGCFNWRPYTNGNTTSFEPEMYSLLPSPENLTPIQSKQHEYTLMDMVQQHQQNNPHAASLSTPSDWFLMGSKELVSNFSRSMSALGHFGDYWQECTKEMARSFALALLSGPTHLIDLEGIVEDGFNEENTRSLSSEHCIAAVTAMFRFAKLEPPMDHRPSLRVPVRYFICSNLVSTPYDIDHSHAVLIISLHRVIALTRHHRAVEQASLNPELFLKRLHTFTKNSIGKTG